MAGINF